MHYGCIVDNLPVFGLHHAGRVFLDNDIIVSCHHHGGAVITGNMDEEVHDLVRCFRIEVSGWLISQDQLW